MRRVIQLQHKQVVVIEDGKRTLVNPALCETCHKLVGFADGEHVTETPEGTGASDDVFLRILECRVVRKPGPVIPRLRIADR